MKEVVVKTNVYVSGIKIGDALFTPPEVKFEKIECNGGAGKYKLIYGAVEELSASAKIYVEKPEVYAAMSLTNDTPIIFAKALSSGSEVKGRRDVLIGGLDLKENESKAGEGLEIELTMNPLYWLKELEGLPVIEIDKLKDIVRVGGKDLLEDSRKAVGA